MEKKNNMNKIIDLEPAWVGIAPLLCDWLVSGNDEQKQHAREEIMRMAVACDKIRRAQKKGEKTIKI